MKYKYKGKVWRTTTWSGSRWAAYQASNGNSMHFYFTTWELAMRYACGCLDISGL